MDCIISHAVRSLCAFVPFMGFAATVEASETSILVACKSRRIASPIRLDPAFLGCCFLFSKPPVLLLRAWSEFFRQGKTAGRGLSGSAPWFPPSARLAVLVVERSRSRMIRCACVIPCSRATLDAELNDFGAQLAMLRGHAADRDG
jgi:hypothetical protein